MFQFAGLPLPGLFDSTRSDWAFTPAGFPHSDISGSTSARDSPKLYAACHVLHRLLAPRHPPRALCSLTPPASDLAASRGRDPSGSYPCVIKTRRNRRSIYCRTTYPIVKVLPVTVTSDDPEAVCLVQRSAGRWAHVELTDQENVGGDTRRRLEDLPRSRLVNSVP